jgi:hypothetical protein
MNCMNRMATSMPIPICIDLFSRRKTPTSGARKRHQGKPCLIRACTMQTTQASPSLSGGPAHGPAQAPCGSEQPSCSSSLIGGASGPNGSTHSSALGCADAIPDALLWQLPAGMAPQSLGCRPAAAWEKCCTILCRPRPRAMPHCDTQRLPHPRRSPNPCREPAPDRGATGEPEPGGAGTQQHTAHAGPARSPDRLQRSPADHPTPRLWAAPMPSRMPCWWQLPAGMALQSLGCRGDATLRHSTAPAPPAEPQSVP